MAPILPAQAGRVRSRGRLQVARARWGPPRAPPPAALPGLRCAEPAGAQVSSPGCRSRKGQPRAPGARAGPAAGPGARVTRRARAGGCFGRRWLGPIASGLSQMSADHVAPCAEFRVLNLCQEVFPLKQTEGWASAPGCPRPRPASVALPGAGRAPGGPGARPLSLPCLLVQGLFHAGWFPAGPLPSARRGLGLLSRPALCPDLEN